MNKYEIIIASLPDREEVVAEIWFENNQFAEISQEKGEIRIEFYPKQDGSFWNFNFNEILEAIIKTKKHLTQEKEHSGE